MNQHTYARVAGFGLTVIPHAPFRLEHTVEDPAAIDVTYTSPKGELFARLIPDNGGYKSKIAQNTNSLLDVLEVEAGPAHPDWQIETGVFTCCWPRGYAICSNSFPGDPSPFDFVGTDSQMIYVQQPDSIPDIVDMCGPGQKILSVDRSPKSEVVNLSYNHQGHEWRQQHTVVTLANGRIVVTMQAPQHLAASVSDTTQQIVRSLRPYRAV